MSSVYARSTSSTLKPISNAATSVSATPNVSAMAERSYSASRHEPVSSWAGGIRHLDQLAPQEVRRPLGDVHAGKAPRAGRGVVAGREVHQLVLAGATGDDRRVLLARALDEHLLGATDPRPVARKGGALDHDGQTLEPVCGDLGGHEAVVAAGGLGAGARRED